MGVAVAVTRKWLGQRVLDWPLIAALHCPLTTFLFTHSISSLAPNPQVLLIVNYVLISDAVLSCPVGTHLFLIFNKQPSISRTTMWDIPWPNLFKITLLQTTRKENNWKTEETLARAVVTLGTERIEGSNPWCLWWWWWWPWLLLGSFRSVTTYGTCVWRHVTPGFDVPLEQYHCYDVCQCTEERRGEGEGAGGREWGWLVGSAVCIR